jgi:hypothetical protein
MAAGDTYFVVKILSREHGYRSTPGDLGLRVMVPFSVSFEDLRCRPGPVTRTRLKRAGQSGHDVGDSPDLVVAATDEPEAHLMNRPRLRRGHRSHERWSHISTAQSIG